MGELFDNLNVAIYHEPDLEYPLEAPYSPHINYPEYALKHVAERANRVYSAVRQTLLLLGLDKENFGTPRWNPFKEIVRPGDTVVIKPNFVLDRHDEGGDLFSIITHPSVIRALIDYVYLALEGKGRIVIADAPQMDCDFGALLEKTKLPSIQELYKSELGFEIEILDLREFWYDVKKNERARAAYTKYRFMLPGDPQGCVVVPLGKDSLFYGIDSRRFYGADYDRGEVIRYHHGEVQEYVVSKTILSADCVILVPKLKVHKKVGITLNVKGLVGMVTNKNCLVHCRLGAPSKGGDQFPDDLFQKKERIAVKLERLAYDILLSHRNPITDTIYEITARVVIPLFKWLGVKVERNKRILDAGNWHGNDSAWRMAVDLLRIFLYADKTGVLYNSPIRRVFSVVDGIVGGEGEGPLTPKRKPCGLVVAGSNLSAVDLVCSRLMGFDFNKIKILKYLIDNPDFSGVNLKKIRIHTNGPFTDIFNSKDRFFAFEPPPGWKGYIEV